MTTEVPIPETQVNIPLGGNGPDAQATPHLVLETSGKFSPFRPRYEHAVNPYDMLDRDFFSSPPIGIDGGILIPSSAIGSNPDSKLDQFLISRTMPIPEGKPRAAVHEAQNQIVIYRSLPLDSWSTSRGESYYSSNFSYSKEEKPARKAQFVEKLRQDSELLSDWSEVESDLQAYDPETSWRVRAAVMQNLSSDIIGLAYAFRIASDYDTEFKDRSASVQAVCEEAVAEYYRYLLDPEFAPDMDKYELLAQAVETLAEIDGIVPDNIDDIRTQRETDMTYQTLAGAQTFMNEFGEGEDAPPVLVPMIGAYDLGPALKALGYKGDVHYILPAHKHLANIIGESKDQGRKSRVIEQDVAEQIPDDLHDAVIFDDSLGTGKTLIRVMHDLENKNLRVRGIRTLFINDTWYPAGTKFVELYGDRYQPYFSFPIRRQHTVEDAEQFIFPRWITQTWAANNKSALGEPKE